MSQATVQFGGRSNRDGQDATRQLNATVWILSAWQDLLLFVAAPLLIIPLFLIARTQWDASGLAIVIISLGGVGHHLPGMLRAYGDKALFARFKYRFIVAPIFLVAVLLFL